VPEGDTIHRAAATLQKWLAGREVTSARTTVDGLPAHTLVGQTVVAVEPRAKHLLIRFSGGTTLHSHMKMTGAWHVYRAGERWQKPARQARFVLEAGDRLAVCFNAPILELLADQGEHLHPSLTGLGPDVLQPPVDLAEVRRRARMVPASTTIGELLLDQQVVSGIGNIWRCETLFLRRVDPFVRSVDVPDDVLDGLVTAASELMQRSADPAAGAVVRPRWVYRRHRRPCRRCDTPIRSMLLGSGLPRTLYWCPACQPRQTVTA
jgi:endonuclease-8